MSGLSKYIPGVTRLMNKTGEVGVESLAGKTVFFYFSASWCPPCRGFTPQLSEFYGKFHTEKNFEVVFVSWDEEESDFNGYYAKMPWLALPFAKRDTVQELVKTFNVQSIPTLIGVNADTGAVITTAARNMVVTDPEGKNYPWGS